MENDLQTFLFLLCCFRFIYIFAWDIAALAHALYANFPFWILSIRHPALFLNEAKTSCTNGMYSTLTVTFKLDLFIRSSIGASLQPLPSRQSHP